ncbi:MAG TPA: aldehyde dehydrogenase family protein, partial [Actinobacteria bacterium]|nr:aldehyde dehydrogenase family protein [Actinomycetota bacterium]
MRKRSSGTSTGRSSGSPRRTSPCRQPTAWRTSRYRRSIASSTPCGRQSDRQTNVQEQHVNTITHWIDNRPYASTSSRRGPVYEPASGEQSAQVAFAAAEDVDRAVASAVRAYPGWRETSLSRRQQILFEYRELVNRHKQDMARAVTLEHGKTLPDALGEINRGPEVVEFACNIAHLLKGEYSENVSTGVDTWTVRQP